jgi:hypothetical protein
MQSSQTTVFSIAVTYDTTSPLRAYINAEAQISCCVKVRTGDTYLIDQILHDMYCEDRSW